jgi:hypothetical protein
MNWYYNKLVPSLDDHHYDMDNLMDILLFWYNIHLLDKEYPDNKWHHLIDNLEDIEDLHICLDNIHYQDKLNHYM